MQTGSSSQNVLPTSLVAHASLKGWLEGVEDEDGHSVTRFHISQVVQMEKWAIHVLVCLASVITAGAQLTGGGTGGGNKPACIHGGDLVLTPFGTKLVSQLEIGDHVAVGFGHNRFQPIITFLHRDPTRNARGFRFTTATGKTVTLSDDHLIFVAPNKSAILAKNVRIGDRLYLASDGNYEEDAVSEMEQSEVEGRYSPLTQSGVILVNDMLVSCYSQIEDHHLMHKVVNWLLPFTFSFSDGSPNKADGLHSVGSAMWHYLRHWFVAQTN